MSDYGDTRKHNILSNKYAEALSLYRQGQCGLARAAYEQILVEDTQCINAYNDLGVIYFREGNYLSAEETLSQAIRMSPTYGQAHFNLGLVLEKCGKVNRALDEYTVAAGADPPTIEAYSYCARLHTERRELEEAFDWAMKTLQSNQPRTNQIVRLAAIWQENFADYYWSRLVLQYVVTVSPSCRVAHILLAGAYNECTDIDASINALLEGLTYFPRDFEMMHMLALQYGYRFECITSLRYFATVFMLKPWRLKVVKDAIVVGVRCLIKAIAFPCVPQ